MLLPSIFADDVFSDWAKFSRDFDKNVRNRVGYNQMRTDIKETADAYELYVDVPGYKKEDISAEIKDGYLILNAHKESESESSEEGAYIRKERFCGNLTRSFYIGKELSEEDIKASYENGILSIQIPKLAPEKLEQNRHFVAIAG